MEEELTAISFFFSYLQVLSFFLSSLLSAFFYCNQDDKNAAQNVERREREQNKKGMKQKENICAIESF
jgi:hypothetical protein